MPAQSITLGLMVSLLHKQWNEHRFNQLRVMDLMTKSFFLHFMAGEERHMQNKTGLRGDVFVREPSCEQERCFCFFAVISLHVMISECDQPIAVNLQQMKCITV